jgi:hypothetical protein
MTWPSSALQQLQRQQAEECAYQLRKVARNNACLQCTCHVALPACILAWLASQAWVLAHAYHHEGRSTYGSASVAVDASALVVSRLLPSQRHKVPLRCHVIACCSPLPAFLNCHMSVVLLSPMQAAAHPEAKKGRGGPRKAGSKANLSGMEPGAAASTGGPAASGGQADSGSGRKRGRTSVGATS